MTHPLYGVHGRQHRFPDRVGTVAHITEGTRADPAFLYLLLDKPAPDGKMVLIIGADDFIPTDPAALRERLALSPARELGTAIAGRLLDGMSPQKIVDGVARALGDSDESWRAVLRRVGYRVIEAVKS